MEGCDCLWLFVKSFIVTAEKKRLIFIQRILLCLTILIFLDRYSALLNAIFVDS